MRRGQELRYAGPGFTKKQLLAAADVSPKIFDAIRKASRINGPSHGGRNWLFPPHDVQSMIDQARKKTHTERGGSAIATAWELLLAGKLNPPETPDQD